MVRFAVICSIGSLVLAGCSGAVGDAMDDEGPSAAAEPTPGENGEDGGEGGSDAGGAGGDTGSTAAPDSSAPPPKDSGSPAPDSSAPPSDTGAPSTPGGDPPVSGMPLAANLGIQEIAFFQGVKVPVARNGAKITPRAADVIAGRAALVRVYLAPKAGWSPREVLGELRLESASGAKTFSATTTPSASSTDASLASTLNFEVPTDAIAVDTRYSVTLFTKTAAAGDTSGARYPSGGALEALDARSTGPALKIVIVPVRYDADGSGRLPDVSAAQIEQYRRAFYAMYPAREVQVTVRAPYPYAGSVSPTGSGFSTLLQSIVKLRQTDGAPKDVYYYGAFNARSSFTSYCSGGCVTGLCGLLTYPSDSTARACVGVGYTGAQSANTAAHEIGHAHGRSHAPCGGASGADSKFPYSGGRIGGWGWNLVTKKLVDPAVAKDFIGYCSPEWVSDYTFDALADRMSFVSASKSISFAWDAPRTYRFVDVGADGRLAWGDTITLQEPPLGEPQTLTWEAEDGSAVATATGHLYPYDDLPGGYMLVPEAPVTARALTVEWSASAAGRGWSLPSLLDRRLSLTP